MIIVVYGFCSSLSTISATTVQYVGEENIEAKDGRRQYDGYQVIRALPSSHDQLDLLHYIGEIFQNNSSDKDYLSIQKVISTVGSPYQDRREMLQPWIFFSIRSKSNLSKAVKLLKTLVFFDILSSI